MLRRLLFLALAVFAAFWWLRRILRPARREAAQPRGRAATPLQGEMVRDRVCNTFLPRARALTLQVGSEQEFFCSERCRDAFVNRTRAQA